MRTAKWMLVVGLAAWGCDDGDTTDGAGGAGGGATADMGAGGAGGGAGGAGGAGGGAGGEGGAGGAMPTCESECGRVADCSAASDACPGITADSRDAFYDGCLEACAGNPALVALAASQAECEGLISTLSTVNADFAATCEGGGEGGAGGEGGGIPDTIDCSEHPECFSNFDCADDRVCIVDSQDAAVACCVPGPRGEDPAGTPCGDGDGQLTCASSVCIEGDAEALCSTPCETEDDCPENMQRCFPIEERAWCFPTN